MMALQIVYTRDARLDYMYFRHYYEKYFPEGLENAARNFIQTMRVLASFPAVGRPIGKLPRRCFKIQKTNFTIVYRAAPLRLEVLRILDQRSEKYLKNITGHDHTH
jgi:plasmid stabilization system protein ParE